METEFRLTGKHVLATLLSFFLVILAVNVIFINFAMKTFPGEKEEKSYMQGLNYNERLAARAEQALLGWTAAIEEASLKDGEIKLVITMTNKSGALIPDLDVTGVISRPTNADQDRVFVFTEVRNGEYAATAPASAGAWNFEGKAISGQADEFEFGSRLVLR